MALYDMEMSKLSIKAETVIDDILDRYQNIGWQSIQGNLPVLREAAHKLNLIIETAARNYQNDMQHARSVELADLREVAE